MKSTTPLEKAQRRYVLQLVKGLLGWETSISRGGSLPFPEIEMSSRLILMDRLLTATAADLATLGLPNPLPSPGELLQQTIRSLERRHLQATEKSSTATDSV